MKPCERCGKVHNMLDVRRYASRRYRCPTCKRLICRGCLMANHECADCEKKRHAKGKK